MKSARTKRAANSSAAKSYRHPEAESPMHPDVGTQPQLKKKPPQTYSCDSSLLPALDWDGQNPARERGEALIREVLDPPSLSAPRPPLAS